MGCSVADILDAFGDAIADGVDIISASLEQYRPLPYFEDVIDRHQFLPCHDKWHFNIEFCGEI